MHRTYEAVYENGRLEWTGERPDGERHRARAGSAARHAQHGRFSRIDRLALLDPFAG